MKWLREELQTILQELKLKRSYFNYIKVGPTKCENNKKAF
jgi:hypothetical protein